MFVSKCGDAENMKNDIFYKQNKKFRNMEKKAKQRLH